MSDDPPRGGRRAPKRAGSRARRTDAAVPVITHPEKVLFPDDGITKGEFAAYYEAVAPLMIPHMSGRPISMERFPSGIGAEGFYHKSVTRGFPAWLQRVEVPKKGGSVHHPLVFETRDLLWLANQNCITPHVWTTRVPDLEHPDICVFDLDPSIDDSAMLRAATLTVRDFLAELGLQSRVKTTGSKGFHVAVALDGSMHWSDVARFSHAVGGALVRREPDVFTQEFSKADRGERILIDTGRNELGATFAAAYAVRARPGAPVSAPCTWDEVESGAVLPATFTVRSMAARVAEVGDLWHDMAASAVSLSAAAAQLRSVVA